MRQCRGPKSTDARKQRGFYNLILNTIFPPWGFIVFPLGRFSTDNQNRYAYRYYKINRESSVLDG